MPWTKFKELLDSRRHLGLFNPGTIGAPDGYLAEAALERAQEYLASGFTEGHGIYQEAFEAAVASAAGRPTREGSNRSGGAEGSGGRGGSGSGRGGGSGGNRYTIDGSDVWLSKEEQGMVITGRACVGIVREPAAKSCASLAGRLWAPAETDIQESFWKIQSY